MWKKPKLNSAAKNKIKKTRPKLYLKYLNCHDANELYRIQIRLERRCKNWQKTMHQGTTKNSTVRR